MVNEVLLEQSQTNEFTEKRFIPVSPMSESVGKSAPNKSIMSVCSDKLILTTLCPVASPKAIT